VIDKKIKQANASLNDRFFARLRVLLGEFERELLGERSSNALLHKRPTGVVYAATPYGWDRTDRDRLVPNQANTMFRILRSADEVGREMKINDGPTDDTA